MKLLIAFALFAVAFADIEPVRLQEAPAPAVDDWVHAVNIVDGPLDVQEFSPETVAEDSDRTVRFVEEAVNEEPLVREISAIRIAEPVIETFADDLTVRFVDAPETAEESDRTLRFVEDAVNEENFVADEESPQEAVDSDLTVRFVDEAVNELTEEISAIKIAQPLFGETDAAEDLALKFVESADQVELDAETFAKNILEIVKVAEIPIRGKVFPDPRLR